MDTSLVDLVLSGKYLIAIGVVLVPVVGALRALLMKWWPWFDTKAGGYALSYIGALAAYLGPVLASGSPLTAHVLLVTITTAVTASGLLDHWRDLFQATKKAPVAASIAALLVIASCSSGCPGTAPTGVTVTHDIVACADQGQGVLSRIESEIIMMGALAISTDPDRWAKIETTAINDGLTVGGCAFARVVNDWIKKKSLGEAGAAEQIHVAKSTFEDYRAKYANSSTFRTSQGDL
jgi:hypothetical protein